MKKDVYGVPLEEFDVYTENETDSCFDTSCPPECQNSERGDET